MMDRNHTERAIASIEGVTIVPLHQIRDERGSVYHMLKAVDDHFIQFGEIYFSTVYPGIVKGWKRHRRVTANYACVFGKIRVVLYDDRRLSPTSGNLMEVVIGPDQYSLILIPPRVWHGFQGIDGPHSVLANCATEPHDPSELDVLDINLSQIPYRWPTPSLAAVRSPRR
jgi:dTDP-4-dehydrorhamnose 3,5-epimerase